MRRTLLTVLLATAGTLAAAPVKIHGYITSLESPKTFDSDDYKIAPTAFIAQGNTLANPKFKDGDTLKTFDYVVANPPFSDKGWTNGVDLANDPYQRFKPFGTPPARQGDYAYL